MASTPSQIFIGQVMGTSVGTNIFVHHGWRASALFNMGLYGFQLLILLIRGPHVGRYTWVGWEGGFESRKRVVEEREREKEGDRGDQVTAVPEVQKEKEGRSNDSPSLSIEKVEMEGTRSIERAIEKK